MPDTPGDSTNVAGEGTPSNPPVDPETQQGLDDQPLAGDEATKGARPPRSDGSGGGAGAPQPSARQEQRAEQQVQQQEGGSGGAGEVPSFDVVLRIRRYDPDRDAEAHWEDYHVTVHATDRLLDALHSIKWEQDGSLTFRRSCAHGVCGSDAMRINGRNRLACKTLLKDLNPDKPILVEPIKGLEVEKDLVVDMDPFFAAYREVMPFLITRGNEPSRERLQSQEQRDRFDDTTKCILCAACTTSCPVFWGDGQYFGPAAIVNAHRFIFDSRDDGADQRLEVLNDKEGVWRCRTTFNCTDACPRGIQVTKAISEVKQAIMRGKA